MSADLRALVAELREARTDYDGTLMPDHAEPIGIDCGLLRKVEAALDAQAGMVMVPRVPTEDMVIAGFESEPDPVFSPLHEWEEYEAMAGCRQAAHRARLCYAAMLAAAPAGPVEGG